MSTTQTPAHEPCIRDNSEVPSAEEVYRVVYSGDLLDNPALVNYPVEYLHTEGWLLLLGKEVYGWDGGEPEDQSLVRDWAWVPELLNRELAKRREAEMDNERLRSELKTVEASLKTVEASLSEFGELILAMECPRELLDCGISNRVLEKFNRMLKCLGDELKRRGIAEADCEPAGEMTLEQAISHAEEQAQKLSDRAAEHRQLAVWLGEIQERRLADQRGGRVLLCADERRLNRAIDHAKQEGAAGDDACAINHRRLASWLEELRARRQVRYPQE